MAGVSECDLDWLASIGADDDVIEAHLEVSAGFASGKTTISTLARHESHMRLFDDEMEDVEDTDDGAPEEGLCRAPAQGPITR
jgi:hypothetical protein